MCRRVRPEGTNQRHGQRAKVIVRVGSRELAQFRHFGGQVGRVAQYELVRRLTLPKRKPLPSNREGFSPRLRAIQLSTHARQAVPAEIADFA